MDYWRNWTPGEQIIDHNPKTKPTKPTKPSSVGFVSSRPVQIRIISHDSGMAIHDPAAWAADFHHWAITRCVFRDRCFGSVGALLSDFTEWQAMRDEVPCTRMTFESLLRNAEFLFAEGLVYGLLLKADVVAMEAEDTVPLAPTVTGTVRDGILPRALSQTQGWISRRTGSLR
jgi:hypothetical protein